MNWLRRWMSGRNGSDPLSITLYALALGCSILAICLKLDLLDGVALVLFGVGLFRTLSRDLPRRQKENHHFLQLFTGFRRWRDRAKDTDHRYFKCPGCGQLLRVPRGKGTISITCRKCGTVFQKKT